MKSIDLPAPGLDWGVWLAAAIADAPACSRLIAAEATLQRLKALAPTPARERPYTRSSLIVEGGDELTLVRWRRDLACTPHDHGTSDVTTMLVQGQIVERLWRWTGAGLVLVEERAAMAPAVLLCQPGEIHDVHSPSGAVTVNLYRGGGGSMRMFDPVRRESIEVRHGCGAWLPVDAAMVVARTLWASEETA